MTPLPCPAQLELGQRYARPLSEMRRDWIESAARRVPVMFEPGTEFSSDDLHRVLGEPPERNWFGVLLAQLKNEGVIEQQGYVTSRRPEANGRAIRTWRLRV